MYELCKCAQNTYYINCPSKIGIYVNNNNEAYLIDSGNDKDAGKKVKKILDTNGWTLKAIINTHSHADHIGGNKYLQDQTNCKIFAKNIEQAFINAPILEPSFLYGGYAYEELKHKFLYASESRCLNFAHEDFPKIFEIIDLPGHSFDMIGVKTPDDVMFIADSISSKATIEKYGISFIYDVKAYKETLNKLKGLSSSLFVPSHADVSENISELIDYNMVSIDTVCSVILELTAAPISFEALLKAVFNKFGLSMTHEQHVLISSALKSYLTYLKNDGRVNCFIENNMLLWFNT